MKSMKTLKVVLLSLAALTGGMHLRDGEGKLLLCHLKRLR
jgi:hypothetical protein